MKKIEEAAKDFGNQGAWQCPVSFEEGVKFAQRWIPVEEELPEINNETILAKHKTGVVRLVKIDDYLTQIIIKKGYTHWRLIELE